MAGKVVVVLVPANVLLAVRTSSLLWRSFQVVGFLLGEDVDMWAVDRRHCEVNVVVAVVGGSPRFESTPSINAVRFRRRDYPIGWIRERLPILAHNLLKHLLLVFEPLSVAVWNGLRVCQSPRPKSFPPESPGILTGAGSWQIGWTTYISVVPPRLGRVYTGIDPIP